MKYIIEVKKQGEEIPMTGVFQDKKEAVKFSCYYLRKPNYTVTFKWK